MKAKHGFGHALLQGVDYGRFDGVLRCADVNGKQSFTPRGCLYRTASFVVGKAQPGGGERGTLDCVTDPPLRQLSQ